MEAYRVERFASVAMKAISRGASGCAISKMRIPAVYWRPFRRSRVVGLSIDLHRPHARPVDGKQQVVVGLEMDGSGIGRAGQEGDGPRVLRIAHVEDGDAVE